MAMLIDVDKVIHNLHNEIDNCTEETSPFPNTVRKLVQNTIDYLRKQPTVDAVEVVHGRWISIGGNRYTRISQCSNCCAKYDFMSNYCPNCGAKMDGERKDNERKAD